MGVKLKRIRGKWYIVVNYRGRRKTKAVSRSRKVAEDVRRKVEKALAMGDLGIFAESERSNVPTVSEYAERWLKTYIAIRRKAHTHSAYEIQVRIHIAPYFGNRRLNEITPAAVEDFAAHLATAKTAENGARLSQNSIRLVLCVLRSMFAHARRNRLIESNPAAGLGETIRSEKPAREIQAMTRKESEALLAAAQELFTPAIYALFLVAIRAGLRIGEIAGLKWGDINFGEDEQDGNRYILVQRQWTGSEYTTPKSGKSRRVDLSRQLRAVLAELRESRLLTAMMAGRASVADDLVFTSDVGGPIVKQNIAPRYMEPALEKAGLRHFNFHALRHTFAALLLQAGVSPAYVQRQMGHSSIKITVDTYGHFIPGENTAWIDRVDGEPTLQTNANPAQKREYQENSEGAEALAIAGVGGTIEGASSITSPYAFLLDAFPNLSL